MQTFTKNGTLAYAPGNRVYAKINRREQTKAEGLLWHMVLKQKRTKYRFVRQKPIGNYIADFYCAQLMVIVEVDGETHKFTEDLDYQRTKYLEKIGIKIIRYTNFQIYHELDNVFNQLLLKLEDRAKTLGVV